jgi:putative peptidoglycan lipid II flippase
MLSPPGYNGRVKRQTILAGASIMMVATLLSRLLGYVREAAMAHFWGNNKLTAPHTDAFWAAFGVPDLLYYLLAGGALGAAVIPVATAYLHRGEQEEGWRVANTLFTFFGMCAVAGVAVIMAFAPRLVFLVAPGFMENKVQVAECAAYVRILAPMVAFTVTSGLSTALLQSHRHFTAPSMAWLVYNFGIIGGAFVGGMAVNRYAGDPTGLRMPAYGVLVGAVLLVAVQVPSLLARGFRPRLALEMSHPGVRETLRLFVPYMLALAATQICLLWLPGVFGSYFKGGVTSLRYANRLVILPYGLFGIAISTAAFPAMAERVAAGDMGEFRRLVSGSLRAVLFLAIPSAAAIFVLAGPILRLLWKSETGQFNEAAVAMSAFSLPFFVGSLIALCGLQITNRAFFSLKDRRTPLLVALGYNAVIVVIALVLMHTRLQYAAVAAGISVGTLVGMLAMLELLRRRLGGIDGRTIAFSVLRIILASAAMAAVALMVSQWSGRMLHVPTTHFTLTAPSVDSPVAEVVTRRVTVGLQVLLSLGVGVFVYALVLRLLGAPELGDITTTLRRRRATPAADQAAEPAGAGR